MKSWITLNQWIKNDSPKIHLNNCCFGYQDSTTLQFEVWIVCPWKVTKKPKRKACLPTIMFKGQTVKLRGSRWFMTGSLWKKSPYDWVVFVIRHAKQPTSIFTDHWGEPKELWLGLVVYKPEIERMDTKDDFGLENSISTMAILYMLNFSEQTVLFPTKIWFIPKSLKVGHWPSIIYVIFPWNSTLTTLRCRWFELSVAWEYPQNDQIWSYEPFFTRGMFTLSSCLYLSFGSKNSCPFHVFS